MHAEQHRCYPRVLSVSPSESALPLSCYVWCLARWLHGAEEWGVAAVRGDQHTSSAVYGEFYQDGVPEARPQHALMLGNINMGASRFRSTVGVVQFPL
jgi:hypothetical protein